MLRIWGRWEWPRIWNASVADNCRHPIPPRYVYPRDRGIVLLSKCGARAIGSGVINEAKGRQTVPADRAVRTVSRKRYHLHAATTLGAATAFGRQTSRRGLPTPRLRHQTMRPRTDLVCQRRGTPKFRGQAGVRANTAAPNRAPKPSPLVGAAPGPRMRLSMDCSTVRSR